MEIIRRYILEEKLAQSSRKRKKVYTRNYLFAYLRYTYKKSYESIASEFNRNHATVIHGINMYNIFKDDKYFKELTREAQEEFPMGICKTESISNCLMYEILNKEEIKLFNKNING